MPIRKGVEGIHERHRESSPVVSVGGGHGLELVVAEGVRPVAAPAVFKLGANLVGARRVIIVG